MRNLTTLVVPCALVIFVTGCASTPASRYYTLSAETEPAATSSGLSVVVGPVSVPDEVDRPQFVIRTGPNQVRVDEFNLWAAPLQDNILRVVAQNLAALLGTPHVTLFPQTLSTDVGYRVAIEVQRFDSAPGEAVNLDATWTVRRTKDRRAKMGRTTVREAVQENTYEALAAAHSRALGRLSRDIADAVRTLDRAKPEPFTVRFLADSAESSDEPPGLDRLFSGRTFATPILLAETRE